MYLRFWMRGFCQKFLVVEIILGDEPHIHTGIIGTTKGMTSRSKKKSNESRYSLFDFEVQNVEREMKHTPINPCQTERLGLE